MRRAVDLVRPAINQLLADTTGGYLCVPDPHASRDVAVRFIYEESFGDPDEWEYDYLAIARSKAGTSYRTGTNSRIVATEEPYLLREGDTQYVGAVVFGPSRRLVVAFSGLKDYLDEMIDYWVAAAIQAVSREEHLSVTADDEDVFPWGKLVYTD